MNVTRKILIGLALILFAGTLWLHSPAVGGGFLTRMDDDAYLQQATRLKKLDWAAIKWAFTTTEPYYHPLPRLTFVLDYQLWGAKAQDFHMVNVLLHAVDTALVFGFLWTLLGATTLAAGERLAVAFGVALVFGIHPLQVESVAWIAARVQLLCTVFEIGCIWAYVAGARKWTVWTLFALALLCKPTAISLLFAMLAIDYFPLRRHERLGWGKLLREKTVLIALAVAAVVATMFTESHAGGLLEPLKAVTPAQRVFLALQSLAFYPWKLAWPAWLSPYYPLGLGFSLRPWPVFLAALGVGTVTAVSLWRWRRTPALIACWGAYVMFILPVSGLTLRGWQAAADRYAYMAILPLLLLAGGAAVWLWRRGAAAARVALVCLLTGEICFFGIRTRAQTPVWQNDESLWRGVLAHYPDSAVANEMLAQTLLNRDDFDEGIACARRAVKCDPSAETHRNLAIALTRAGKLNEAIGEFEQALKLNPNLADVHHNLALALVNAGRTQEAIEHWQDAVQIRPDYAEAYCNLAIILQRMNRIDEAIKDYEQALRARPDYAEAHFNLGVALVRSGRVPEAIKHWEAAVKINPDYAEAQCDLGVALEQSGQLEDAVGHYRQALRIQPNLASVHYNLGVVLAKLGRSQEAIDQWEQASRLNPHDAATQYNLGVMLEQTGRIREAIAHYEAAVRLQPDFTEAQNRLMRLQAAP